MSYVKEITYTVQTLSPVAFAEKNNDATLVGTKQYIPGSAIRGLVAEQLLKSSHSENAHKDATFYTYILSGKVRFLPAYPCPAYLAADGVPMVMPASLVKHKTGGDIKDITVNTDTGGAIGYKKMKGFVVKTGETLYPVETATQVQLHIARTDENSRLAGRSLDGHIFNYEYIEPEQEFKGSLIVDDDIADEVYAFMHEVMEGVMRLGKSRQVQYGSCELHFSKPSELTVPQIRSEQPFFLYALTPYIPEEEWYRTDYVCRALLASIVEKAAQYGRTWQCLNTEPALFAAQEDIGGYVSVWGARQERMRAVSAGSMIACAIEGITKEDLPLLQTILAEGMGTRTEEGYGQFWLWQGSKDAYVLGQVDNTVEKPDLSDAVKTQAKAVIHKRILTEVRKWAESLSVVRGAPKHHILNRIETIMDSDLSKTAIQAIISDWKRIARNNLECLYIGDTSSKEAQAFNDSSVYQLLLELDGAKGPYTECDWPYRIGLVPKVRKQLQSDLGDTVLTVDENMLYKEFWLWWARHAKNKTDGTMRGE